ncbi:hypothetical protein KNT64_gp180 [Pseudomonas phage PspYZU05]|uniref:Uncharacterized protein n=1 Tax=Pseudomonas phage PspYZU05 TaxID=1983556 RepID=A0A2U7NS23_9CAUD|nr:hypothetical protein KNT64_gp180 [Pseudomonas phage PspYZU05]ASD52132.1 hypothetical protein PspYZU05_180 [Pseudomonas phage PspYZU05]
MIQQAKFKDIQVTQPFTFGPKDELYVKNALYTARNTETQALRVFMPDEQVIINNEFATI